MQKVFFTVVGHVLHISPEKNNSKMQVKQKDDFLAALLQQDLVLLVNLRYYIVSSADGGDERVGESLPAGTILNILPCPSDTTYK